MRHEAYFLLFLGVFGAIVAIIYGLLSAEWAGTAMLTGFFLLGIFPGGYYYWWSKRMTPRAEDNPRAEPADGAGVVGTFPSSSIWPFVLGLGAAAVGLALVFGFWTAIVGFFLALSAVIGVVMESRHGGLAH